MSSLRDRVARNLRSRRKRANLTQRAFAESVGVTILSVQNWEAGRKFPMPESLDTAAEVLGVDVGTLARAPISAVDTHPESG